MRVVGGMRMEGNGNGSTSDRVIIILIKTKTLPRIKHLIEKELEPSKRLLLNVTILNKKLLLKDLNVELENFTASTKNTNRKIIIVEDSTTCTCTQDSLILPFVGLFFIPNLLPRPQINPSQILYTYDNVSSNS